MTRVTPVPLDWWACQDNVVNQVCLVKRVNVVQSVLLDPKVQRVNRASEDFKV